MSTQPAMIAHFAHRAVAGETKSAQAFADVMRSRRSVRDFSDAPVARETIIACVDAANSAPSGANKQPWRFVAVSDPELKRTIRVAAEAEEKKLYESRANDDWLADLALLGTTWEKPFLETAPWLVVVFRLTKDDRPQRVSDQVYYTNESVGIAVGLFIAALHHAGLVTLTHTPSPMRFLGEILARPAYERPYLLLPVGYPAKGCMVPDIQRKALKDVVVFDRG